MTRGQRRDGPARPVATFLPRVGLIAAVALAVAVTHAPALAVPDVAADATPALQGELTPPPEPVVDGVPATWPPPPEVAAEAFVLLDAASGQVLAADDADERRPVASTVKVLTALTALRRSQPDEVVTVGDEVVGIGGAGVGLAEGDRWTVDDLLDGLIARSGNDAAVVLATHVGGTVPGFVDQMRRDAAVLGLTGVRLVSPSGLQDDNRLSAQDLATITRATLTMPAFRDAASAETVSLPGIGTLASRNELLGEYPGATGVKTGFTMAAGNCLVASARRDGHELIAVVLGSDTPDGRFADAEALLDHGFGVFAPATAAGTVKLTVAGGEVALTTDPVTLLAPDGELDVVPALIAEPSATATIATAPITFDGRPIGEVPVAVADRRPGAVAGGAALGRFVADRFYTAARAVTIAGRWGG